MFAQLVAVAALAISAQSVIAAACTRSYTIQAGDYCDKISQAQNVSTYQIAAVNSDKVNSGCSNLVPGESLCLAQNEAEDCRTTYIVLPGDTCADVAQKNALNTTILYLNNPQIDEACSNIYDGEVLCTAKTVQAPPIPAGGVALPAPNASSTTLVAPAAIMPAATPVVTPAAAAAPIPVVTPAPADDDNCDDDSTSADDDNSDDCDADDNTPSPPAAASKPPVAAKPATTPAPSTSDNGDDDDDDDLPFCDEL